MAQTKPGLLVMDMVHHNPGEPLTVTAFTQPQKLVSYGYNAQVINDFTFAHAALTFDELNPQIFPQGSPERRWVMQAAEQVRRNLQAAKNAGLKAYYFTDIIVLPKRLVELYHDEICDENGRISFERPMTNKIHRIMLDELFKTFPELDGLVIRTGETYLNNVPYHTGGNPITKGESSHIKIINFLREEICVKRNKMMIYRTWDPHGFFHEDTSYYLKVTNALEPHPNLIFSIKHTKGDYQRTFPFNPTLMIGKHGQIVEVQCQREAEGKGAYPNYIMDAVINGFEEYKTNTKTTQPQCLNDIKNNPLFRGVWSWSRGGGWKGPYITNELWCDINAYVISQWANHTNVPEASIFNQYMDTLHLQGTNRKKFRELCLLSAKAIIRGHGSISLPVDSSWVWWMRDQFLAGIDSKPDSASFPSEGLLNEMFKTYYQKNMLLQSVKEKQEAVQLWESIVKLSQAIQVPDTIIKNQLIVSSMYGLILHRIIAAGWKTMAFGFIGDRTGIYNKAIIKQAAQDYYAAWDAFKDLKKQNQQCATLYEPYAFVYAKPDYHSYQGMDASVEKYNKMVSE